MQHLRSERSSAHLQALLQRNIELNDSLIRAAGGSATAFPLVWGQTDCSTLPSEWQNPDFVLAADVVYHRELFSKLLDALDCLGAGSFYSCRFDEFSDPGVLVPCNQFVGTVGCSSGCQDCNHPCARAAVEERQDILCKSKEAVHH